MKRSSWEPSEPERKLKDALDEASLKYSFQHSLRSGFIIDFAFPDKMVAVEVDGFYHQFRKKQDRFRDYILKRAGWKTIRFTADEVMDSPPDVIRKIKEELMKL